MNNTLFNGAGGFQFREPDAHCQAAIVLVESLIHGLIDRNILSTADAVEIVDTAIEVQSTIVAEAIDDRPETKVSIRLLEAISASLSKDMPTV